MTTVYSYYIIRFIKIQWTVLTTIIKIEFIFISEISSVQNKVLSWHVQNPPPERGRIGIPFWQLTADTSIDINLHVWILLLPVLAKKDNSINTKSINIKNCCISSFLCLYCRSIKYQKEIYQLSIHFLFHRHIMVWSDL